MPPNSKKPTPFLTNVNQPDYVKYDISIRLEGKKRVITISFAFSFCLPINTVECARQQNTNVVVFDQQSPLQVEEKKKKTEKKKKRIDMSIYSS